jgi:hypothetical protein
MVIVGVIRLTKYAQEALHVRSIALAWIEEVVSSPDFAEADPRHPECTRSYKAIPAFGGRVLRVVHRPEGDDILVITMHFDRGARR